MSPFSLGIEVIDKQTGFRGTIVAQVRYLHDPYQWGVQAPLGADGKIPDIIWFDEKRLMVAVPK